MATWARCGRRRAHHVINNFDNRTLCSQRTCNVTKSRENGAVCCLRQDYGEDPYFGRHNLPSNTVYTVPDTLYLTESSFNFVFTVLVQFIRESILKNQNFQGG